MLREIDKKESERSNIEDQLKVYSDRELLSDTYKNITEEHVWSLLSGLAEGLLAVEV